MWRLQGWRKTRGSETRWGSQAWNLGSRYGHDQFMKHKLLNRHCFIDLKETPVDQKYVNQELTHPPAVPGKRVWVGVGWLLLLLLLLLLHGVLLTHTRAARARAPNTPPKTDSFGARARARRAPARMRKGGSGAHKISQNHGIYDVFAASEKTKI